MVVGQGGPRVGQGGPGWARVGREVGARDDECCGGVVCTGEMILR